MPELVVRPQKIKVFGRPAGGVRAVVMKKVGMYDERFFEYVGLCHSLPIFQSEGLPIHIQKRHPECLKYIDRIPDIILNPDYIGVNPNEQGTSFELIKTFSDNLQIGIKLDSSGQYFYVATLFDISDSKIERRVLSGRIQAF